MASVKDFGIVLRRLDYSETSQVLAVLCRETGLQRLIGRGVKRGTKKQAAVGIDLLEVGAVVYSRRPGSDAQLGTLIEWRQQKRFDALRRGLAAAYAAQYAADRAVQVLEENDPHPGLFDAFVAFTDEIDAVHALPSLTRHLWTLLHEIGLMPELNRCVGCGGPVRAGAAYFTSREGGLLCRDCEPARVEKRRVERAALEALREPGAPAAPAAVRGAFDLLDYHLSSISGRPSKVREALRATLERGGSVGGARG